MCLTIGCCAMMVYPPLHRAVIDGNLARVQALIAANVGVNTCDSVGRVPLHWAACAYSQSFVASWSDC